MSKKNTTKVNSGHTITNKVTKYIDRHFFWVVTVVCFLCFCACALMFLPGGFSQDAGYQLYQAMGKAELATWHPIGTAIHWRFLLFLAGGNIAVIALMRILVFWTGILLVARFIYIKTRSKNLIWLPIIVGLLPNVLAVLHFNWKDSEMASYLLLSLGIILNIGLIKVTTNLRKATKVILLMISFTLMVYAMSARTNGIIAVIPILVLWFDQVLSKAQRDKLRVFYYIGVIGVAFLTSFVTSHVLAWQFHPVISNANSTMYTLHIVNILPKDQINELEVSNDTKNLLLKFSSGNCSRFNGSWNVVLWDNNCIPGETWDTTIEKESVSQELQTVWIKTIMRHPIKFISYTAVTYANWLTSGAPMEAYGGDYQLPDRIVSPSFSFGQRFFQVYNNNFGNKWMSILYEKWFYLFLITILLVIVIKNKPLRNRRIILAILASGLLFTLSFAPATLTSDYRYVFWTVISSLIALTLILSEINWQKIMKNISFKN